MANQASFMGGLITVPDLAANVQDFAMLKYQGDQQRQAAEDANRFTEKMSNTSWQRGVADMRAAGINPMLSFSQGGASSPTMQAAQVPDYGRMVGGSSVSFGGMSPAAKSQKALVDAQTANANASTAETLARTPNYSSTRQLNVAQIAELKARADNARVDAIRNSERLRSEQSLGPSYRKAQSAGSLPGHFGSAFMINNLFDGSTDEPPLNVGGN